MPETIRTRFKMSLIVLTASVLSKRLRHDSVKFLTSPALHHISCDVLVEHCVLSIRVNYKHAKVEFWRGQSGYRGSREDGDDVTTSRCSGGFEQVEICNIHTNRWWGTMSTFIVWSPNAQAHRVKKKKKSEFTGNNSMFSCNSKVLWGLKERITKLDNGL